MKLILLTGLTQEMKLINDSSRDSLWSLLFSLGSSRVLAAGHSGPL